MWIIQETKRRQSLKKKIKNRNAKVKKEAGNTKSKEKREDSFKCDTVAFSNVSCKTRREIKEPVYFPRPEL